MLRDEQCIKKGIAYACGLLGAREYSVGGITKKLFAKGYCQQRIDCIVTFLLENRWLCERRFCESFIRSRANKGQGLSRINDELVQQSVSRALVAEVVNSLSIDWQRVCDMATEKKILTASLVPACRKERQKLERFLIYRGFSRSEVCHSIEKYLSNFSAG